MANTKLAKFLEGVSHVQNAQEIFDRTPTRLEGDLEVGATIAASGSANEKVRIKNASRVRVTAKISGDGTGVLTLTRYLSDGTTVAATNIAETAAISAGTEVSDDFDNYGSEFLEIKLAESGGADSITVVYVEVEML